MSQKDTLENMQSIARQRGGKCLSTKYVNQRTPLQWQCAEGHEWEATPSMVKGSKNKPGTWCRICAIRMAANKRMYTIDDMHFLAEEHEGKFNSQKYFGSQIKHLWRCDQYPSHPEFMMKPNSVQQGQWCPKCSGNAKLTIDELNKLADAKHSSARCLSTEYKNISSLLEWHCGITEHPSFFKSYRSVKYDGGWCDLCKNEKPKPKKYDVELISRFAKSVNGILIGEEPYRSTKQILRWRCADGHEFSRSFDSILSSRSFCPQCSEHGGIREQFIRELFTYMFGLPFERTRKIPWLINSKGNAMELDGCNTALSLAFEHNGQQHYEIDGYFTARPEQLKKRLADDEEKKQLCIRNGVNLIVVPYTVPLKEIQIYVVNELEKLSIVPINSDNFEPGLLDTSNLERLRQHASSLGGQLLSNRYSGSSEKLQWQCGDPTHPPFDATPSAVINNGHWCRKCASQKQSDSYRVSVKQVQEWAFEAEGELVLDSLPTLNIEKGFSLGEKAEFRCLACTNCHQRTIRQVKQGVLCLCHTKKTRISRIAVEQKLSEKSISLVKPVDEFLRGRTLITVQCQKCGVKWTAKASNAVHNNIGCPNCRRNARITLEKARELADKVGFILKSEEVKSGQDILDWQCKTCGENIKKSYREMRNIRKCLYCRRKETEERLRIS